MKDGPTVALQMIVKDEYEQVTDILRQAVYFDQINLTVSDKPTANKLKKAWPDEHINIAYREWNNRFDDARNANLEMCTTDYFFWIDADDTFPFEEIPKLVQYAVDNELDAVFLPYNYAQDERGNCVTRHWRERLIRRAAGFEWRGWVHETLIKDDKYVSGRVDLEVKHNTSFEHTQEAIVRNHEILKEAYKATEDPRYLHYLGMSEFSLGNYNQAAELLSDYLKVGGSIEDSYRALAVISECAYHLGKHDLALEYATKCMTLKPEYPMAYWLLAQYEADQKNWEEALEWIHVSETKPDPQTLSVYDPSSRERACLIGAQADFSLGNYNDALKWLLKIPTNPQAQELLSDFKNEAEAENFVNLLPKIRKFFIRDEALFNALVDDIKYDTRILNFRQMVTQPRAWGEKSIVIFCGQGYEEWGPSTLDKGMGGSEEAVVYLSRELAKLGYDVTVYGETYEEDPVNADAPPWVHYRPWKEIDVRDEFNIFISWRAPKYLEKINAHVKLADIHDVLPEDMVKNYPDVTYMFKSNYHRDLYKNVDDRNSRVIGNGIKKEQFDENNSDNQ